MFNEFVKVTERKTGERVFINLNALNFIREVKDDDNDYSVLRVKDNFIQVRETFDSFEEFFDELKESDED